MRRDRGPRAVMLTYICLEHVEASNGVVGDERNVIVVCTSRVLCVFVPRRLRGCPAFYPVMNGFFRPHIVAYTNLFTKSSSALVDWLCCKLNVAGLECCLLFRSSSSRFVARVFVFSVRDLSASESVGGHYCGMHLVI